jgi:hypothetical protein
MLPGPQTVTTLNQVHLSASPTVTAAAYAAGNVVGGLLTLTGAVGGTATTALLHKVNLMCKSSQSSQFDVLIFHTNPTNSTFTDKTALAVNVLDFDKIGAVVHVTDWTNLGTPSIGLATNLAISVKGLASQTIYAVIVARGTPTFASTSDITASFTFIQD